MSYTQPIRIPDLVADLDPLDDGLNPHYKAVAPGARAWFNSFHLFPTDEQNSRFSQSQHETLASHAYPFAGSEQLRVACDLINILFGFDDFTDEQNAKEVNHTFFCFLEAMKNPAWDKNYAITKITRDFRIRLERLAGPNNLRRFIRLCDDWAQSIVKEAQLRGAGADVLSEDEYLSLRQSTGAMPLVLALTECCLGIDLPDQAYEDPLLLKAYHAVLEHVSWSNDIISYHREQAMGHTTNFVAVAMKSRNLSLQDAYDYVGARCRQCVEDYVSAREEFRATAGPGDTFRYIEAIGSWITANTIWSFETPRYFGHEAEKVARSLIIMVESERVPGGVNPDADCTKNNSLQGKACSFMAAEHKVDYNSNTTIAA